MEIMEKFAQWSSDIKKEYIIEGVINAKRLVESAFAKHFPEAYDIITKEYPGKFREVVYSILRDIDEIPKCPVCGNDVPLRNYVKGFQDTCSRECAIRNLHREEVIDKISNTRSVSGKTKVSETFHWLKDYDVERDKEDKNYIVLHNYCKHGDVRCVANTVKRQYKLGCESHCMQCNKEIYDTYIPSENEICDFMDEFPDFYKKYSSSFSKQWWLTYHPKELKIIKVHYESCHGTCHGTFDLDNNMSLLDAYDMILNKFIQRPPYESSAIEEYIKELHVPYIHKNGNIFVPDRNVLIEYRGCWFCSNEFIPYSSHMEKYRKYLSEGIQLLSIWQDSWIFKQNIVKSIIRSKLGLIENKIGARKCELKKVSVKDSREFLNANHLQGYCNANYRYGLYWNGELVAMLTFGPSRFKKGEMELLRACTKIGYSVSGGMSRMFKRFIEDSGADMVVSYADCDISVGNLYRNLGFEYAGTTLNWSWLWKDRRVNRFNKIRLNSDGLYKCYGSGTAKYVWKKS